MPLKKAPSFSFILDELAESNVAPLLRTRPMFGCHAVYLGEKIVFILRKKGKAEALRDDGIWVASTPEYVEGLQRTFPALRPIELFKSRGRKGFSGWLNLPEEDEGFEETALALCRMVINKDPRIGKIPKSRTARGTAAKRTPAVARKARPR